MYKKQKSITQANSTMVKSKITWAKNNRNAIRNKFLDDKLVVKCIFLLLLKLTFIFVFVFIVTYF